MRRPDYRQHDENRESAAMTPMIDVVFLLLIFFVCAATGQVPEDLLSTELPPQGAIDAEATLPDPEDPTVPLWIHLSRSDGRTLIELNEREYDDMQSLQQVLAALAEVAPESPVVLDIAQNVPVGDMVRVLDISKAAGFESISFATDKEPGEPGQ